MTESLPQPERRSYTDDELIDQHLDHVEAEDIYPSDAAARMIASQIHDGQASAMYSFVSTGIVTDRMKDELQRNIEAAREQGDQAQLRRLEHLARYVEQCEHEGTENLPGYQWSKAWLEQPEQGSEYCVVCHAFVADPHGVGCPLGTDDEEMLEVVYALQDRHGVAVTHWLNYLGFRSMDELQRAASSFEDHFHGHYPSLDAYRVEHELAPDAYLDQTLHVVEDFHGNGVYVFDR